MRLSTSTGTTGRPTISLFTPHDLSVEYDAACRSFCPAGIPARRDHHARPPRRAERRRRRCSAARIEPSAPERRRSARPCRRPTPSAPSRLWRELRPHRLRDVRTGAPHVLGDREGDGPRPGGGSRDARARRSCRRGGRCRPGSSASRSSAPRAPRSNGAHVCEDEAIVEADRPRDRRARPRGRARAPRGHDADARTTSCCATTSRTSSGSSARPCPCGETHLRAFWDGRAEGPRSRRGARRCCRWTCGSSFVDDRGGRRPAVEFQLVRTADTARPAGAGRDAATPAPGAGAARRRDARGAARRPGPARAARRRRAAASRRTSPRPWWTSRVRPAMAYETLTYEERDARRVGDAQPARQAQRVQRRDDARAFGGVALAARERRRSASRCLPAPARRRSAPASTAWRRSPARDDKPVGSPGDSPFMFDDPGEADRPEDATICGSR